MKKTLFALGISVLFLVTSRTGKADVSVDFFYNNLAGGSWVEVADYGYCWQPDVAVGNASWRPYADGYWAYTDLGWTWVSYENFGWATYHYGRWALLSDYGWVWVPGRDADLEWGPAWVSWRTGGEYIGWAPLPPETITVVESRPLTGHLDLEFNIGPVWYNFVDVRYIGEPVLRERIIAPTQNVTYIQQTVNVTNITYNNKTVYNYGPDINVVNRVATRPIQRLRLDREQNVDVTAAAKSGGLTKVQGDRLVVAAPMHVTRSANQAAPPKIKTKVAAAKVDRGWSVVGDEKAQTEFKNRIRGQDRNNVPPPTGAGAAAQVGTAASTSPGANVNADTAASAQQGQGQGGRRGLRGAAAMAAASASPGTSPAATGASPVQGGRENVARQGRGERRRFQQPTENTSAGGTSAAEDAAGVGAQSDGQGQADVRGRRGRGQEAQNQPPSSNGREAEGPNTASDQSQQGPGGGRHGGRGQFQNPPGQGAGAAQETSDQNQVRRRAQAPLGPQGQGGEGRGQGQGHQGGKRGQGQGEASPAPSPQ